MRSSPWGTSTTILGLLLTVGGCGESNASSAPHTFSRPTDSASVPKGETGPRVHTAGELPLGGVAWEKRAEVPLTVTQAAMAYDSDRKKLVPTGHTRHRCVGKRNERLGGASGRARTDSGPFRTGSGRSRTDFGRPRTGSGPFRTDSGRPRTGSGPSRTDPGPFRTGSGPSRTDSGRPRTGSGPSRTDSGPPRTDSGPFRTGSGRSRTS